MLAQSRPGEPLTCADLVSQSFADTTIASAATVAAGAFEAPPPGPAVGPSPVDYSGLPAFCRVAGSIQPTDDSDIRFEIWLPTDDNWNGRFVQTRWSARRAGS